MLLASGGGVIGARGGVSSQMLFSDWLTPAASFSHVHATSNRWWESVHFHGNGAAILPTSTGGHTIYTIFRGPAMGGGAFLPNPSFPL